MSRQWKRICTMLLVLLSICGLFENVSLQAASMMGKSESEKRVVRIGYIDYAGFITEMPDGTYEGYGVEYLEKISEYTGWEYEFVYDSWENHMQSLKTGEIDFVCHAQKTDVREQTYLFSKYSIGSEASVLYVRMDDNRYYYNDFEAFDGMKIAVLRDSYQNSEFSEYANKKGFNFENDFAIWEEKK